MNKKITSLLFVIVMLFSLITPVSANNINENPGDVGVLNETNIAKISEIINLDSIHFKDANGEIIDVNNPLDLSQTFRMEFDWAIPADKCVSEEAYTFTLGGLADYLTIPEWGLDAILEGTDGTEYGDFALSKEGVVSITFKQPTSGDVYCGEDNVSGNFWFETSFNTAQIQELNELPAFIINIDGNTIGPELPIITEASSISKAGQPNKNVGADKVIWTVDINLDQSAIDATITDNFVNDLVFDSVQIHELEVSPFGKVINVSETPLESSLYTISEDGTVLTMGEIDKAYRITYTTSIKPESMIPGEDLILENTAVLNDGVEDYNSSATVIASYAKMLEKSALYDAFNQKIDWNIQFNFNQQSMSAENTKLRDELDINAYYDASSFEIYKVEIDDAGKIKLDENNEPVRELVDPSEYNLEIVRKKTKQVKLSSTSS